MNDCERGSDDESHVLPIRQPRLLAQPERVVDGEAINGDRQVLRVDLGELLAARVVPGQVEGSEE